MTKASEESGNETRFQYQYLSYLHGVFLPTQGTEVQTHVGLYWKQIGVVALSCVFLFVYEFCER